MIQLKEIIENKDKVINGLKKRGFKKLGTKLHPKTKVFGGILQNECKDLLDKFFI